MKKQLLFLFFIGLIKVYPQNNRLLQAEKQYENYAYVDAIKIYERLYEKGYKSEDMMRKLGNSYYFSANYELAAKWYKELFSIKKKQDPEYYYRYAQTLKSINQIDLANEMMTQFIKAKSNDSRAKRAITQKNYLEIIKNNSGRYLIKNVGFNSEQSDYGAMYYKDKLVFSSARENSSIFAKKQGWTGENFTNLYLADTLFKNEVKTLELFSKKVNSKFNEDTPCFSKDGKTAYFTRNNYSNGKRGKNKERATLLKIYKATFENNEWKNITELPFNSGSYSVAHPALSPDEQTLYFVSDMPGTLGLSDLFKVAIYEDGTFGKPENLGTTINTEARETYPYISSDNELYFASDGHLGLGGLDLFVYKIDENKNGQVINLGEPINSTTDDFAYIIDTLSNTGYFSSNRSGGKGNDDIYWFRETSACQFPCQKKIKGSVIDKDTQEPIALAKVSILDDNYQFVKEAFTSREGQFNFELIDCRLSYHIRIEKEGYATDEQNMPPVEELENHLSTIALEPLIKKITPGDDLAKVFKIKMIYFDLDKYQIREDAALELSKIAEVLKEYPTMQIEIKSHTDSRQTKSYNEKLSNERAKATVNWLIENGIEPTRISGKGYGEIFLLNKCVDGVDCTEEEHQQNRRSEFIVVKI